MTDEQDLHLSVTRCERHLLSLKDATNITQQESEDDGGGRVGGERVVRVTQSGQITDGEVFSDRRPLLAGRNLFRQQGLDDQSLTRNETQVSCQ